VISHVANSSEALASMWNQATETKTASVDYLKKIIADGLGVTDPSPEEIESLMTWKASGKTVDVLATYLSDIVSRRALIGVSVSTWKKIAFGTNLKCFSLPPGAILLWM
jgi:alkaline phosphatase